MIDDDIEIKTMPLLLVSLLASYLFKVRYGPRNSCNSPIKFMVPTDMEDARHVVSMVASYLGC